MADRAATRSSIRRTTPQTSGLPRPSQSPPRRSQRRTRSQSRDIDDTSTANLTATSDQGTAARPNSKGNRGSSTKTGDQKKGSKSGAQNKRLTEVAEVDEESPIRYPELPVNDASEQPEQRRQGPDSPANVSGFSGTTVRTSQSAQELAATNTEEMVASLKDLSDESDKILDLLLPNPLSISTVQAIQKQTSTPKSLESRQFARYSSNFRSYHEVYGDSQYIDPPSILAQILGTPSKNIRSGPWRADPLLYKANLAALIMTLMAQHEQSLENLVDELDKVFPAPFLGAFVEEPSLAQCVDSSALYNETFQLGLDLRTFSFIERARKLMNMSDFDPDSLLQQIFYQDTPVIDGWYVAGLRSEDVNLEQRLRYSLIGRLDLLRQTFSPNHSPPINLERLEGNFSHDQLTKDLAYWAQIRLREVQMQIQSLEGAQGIARALQAVLRNDQGTSEVMDREPLPNTATSMAAEGNMVPQSYKFNSPKARPKAISRLRELDSNRRISREFDNKTSNLADPTGSQTRTQAKTSHETVTQHPPAPNHPIASLSRPPIVNEVPSSLAASWQPPAIDDDQELFVADNTDSIIKPEDIMRRKHQMEDESNKENLAVPSNAQLLPHRQPPTKKPRFIDPQASAERIAWDSQQSATVSASDHSRSVVEGTKVEEIEEQEMSEDEGFEAAMHPVAQSAHRRPLQQNARSGMPSGSARKGPQVIQARQESSPIEDVEDAVTRHNETNNPPLSQIDTYKRVNSTAKTRVAINPKKVQTRTPWSEDEINRILDLIQDHGISWSLLKKMDFNHSEGAQLEQRDQTALKDKARNMKMDYLKCV
ncbi:MAG: hypothetical protein Q9222_007227 [Ikaeria aurantiellina]